MLTSRSSKRIQARVRVEGQEKRIVLNPHTAETSKRLALDYVKDFENGIISEYKTKILLVYLIMVIRNMERESQKFF